MISDKTRFFFFNSNSTKYGLPCVLFTIGPDFVRTGFHRMRYSYGAQNADPLALVLHERVNNYLQYTEKLFRY